MPFVALVLTMLESFEPSRSQETTALEGRLARLITPVIAGARRHGHRTGSSLGFYPSEQLMGIPCDGAGAEPRTRRISYQAEQLQQNVWASIRRTRCLARCRVSVRVGNCALQGSQLPMVAASGRSVLGGTSPSPACLATAVTAVLPVAASRKEDAVAEPACDWVVGGGRGCRRGGAAYRSVCG